MVIINITCSYLAVYILSHCLKLKHLFVQVSKKNVKNLNKQLLELK